MWEAWNWRVTAAANQAVAELRQRVAACRDTKQGRSLTYLQPLTMTKHASCSLTHRRKRAIFRHKTWQKCVTSAYSTPARKYHKLFPHFTSLLSALHTKHARSFNGAGSKHAPRLTASELNFHFMLNFQVHFNENYFLILIPTNTRGRNFEDGVGRKQTLGDQDLPLVPSGHLQV